MKSQRGYRPDQKQSKPRTHWELDPGERAMTLAALAYLPTGTCAAKSERDKRFLMRSDAEDVAAAEAYARTSRELSGRAK